MGSSSFLLGGADGGGLVEAAVDGGNAVDADQPIAHIIVGAPARGLLTIIKGLDHPRVGAGFGEQEVVLEDAVVGGYGALPDGVELGAADLDVLDEARLVLVDLTIIGRVLEALLFLGVVKARGRAVGSRVEAAGLLVRVDHVALLLVDHELFVAPAVQVPVLVAHVDLLPAQRAPAVRKLAPVVLLVGLI